MNFSKKNNIDQLWLNGPRFLVAVIFSIAIIGKLRNPAAFFIIIKSLHIHYVVGEVILAIVLSIELVLVLLLLWKPNLGIAGSSIILVIFTLIILGLYLNGIKSNCGCFGDIIAASTGPAKIVQNSSLVFLLLISWKLRTNDSKALMNARLSTSSND